MLILAAATAVFGSILLLEQRCLGKVAFVQPLILCCLAGMATGQTEAGLWFGISLQLLSIGQGHYGNWALAGIITASSLVALQLQGLYSQPGNPDSLVLLCCAVLAGILADTAEKTLTAKSARPMTTVPLWQSPDSFDAFHRLIRRRVLRGFLFGGLQALLGTAMAVSLTLVSMDRVAVDPGIRTAVVISVPLFGAAVTMGAMSRKRYPLTALIGIAMMSIFTVLP